MARLQLSRMAAAYRAARPRRTSSRSQKVVCGSFQEVCFCFSFLSFPFLHQSPRIALHFSHTIGEALEPKKVTPRHPSWTQGFSIVLDRRRAVSNICQLIYQTSTRENSKERPGPKRCVRPAVGITSASHRNTARACVSLHPRQGLPPPGTVPPSILFRTPGKTSFGWGVTLQMPARVLSSVARHWRDMSSTAFGGGSAGCCATSRAKDPCVAVLVWRSLVFVIVSAAFGCFSFWNISLTLIRLQATTTRFPTRAARRTRAFSSRRAVRWCLRWFRRVRQNKLPHHDCA